MEKLLPILREGDSFSNWKFRLKMLLQDKDVQHTIDVTFEKSMDKDFVKNDNKAKCLIVQCLSDKYLEIIKSCNTALQMINALEQLFERKSVFNKLHLRRKLLTLKCLPGTKLQDFFMTFDSLIGELGAIGSEIEDVDKICYLLAAMPPEYDAVITSIETMSTDSNMNIDFIKARLLDAEIKYANKECTLEQTFSCYTCGKRGHKSFQCKKSIQRRGDGEQIQGQTSYGQGRGQTSYGQERGQTSYGQGSRGYGRWQRRPMMRGRGRSRPSNAACAMVEEEDTKDQWVFTAFGEEEDEIYKEDTNSGSIKFIIDSGATEHLIKECYKRFMYDIKQVEEVKIFVANGQYLTSKERAKISVTWQNEHITIECLIVKGLSYNLLSVRQLLARGLEVKFHQKFVSICKGENIIQGQLHARLYIIHLELDSDKCMLGEDKGKDISLWHRRLGHLNRKSLKILGLPVSNEICESCTEGKSTRRVFKVTEKHSRQIGDVIHSDICGPISPANINGTKYFQVIVDDYSHFVTVKLLKNKNEAEQNLIDYIKQVKTQLGYKTRKLRLDNGGEFTSNYFKDYCRQKGIELQYTSPYTPMQNGASERMNRTLLDKTRTKFAETKLPKHLWGEAVCCSAYELNRCPSRVLQYKTPAMLWLGTNKLDRLKVFGSKAWKVIIPKPNKLDDRAKPMIMVGYTGSGYRLWDSENNKIVYSTDVIFDEKKTVFYNKENDEEDMKINERRIMFEEEEEINRKKNDKQEQTIENNIEEDSEKEVEGEYQNKRTRSGRTVNKPQNLKEYELYTAYCLVSHSQEDIPQTYEEAVKDKEWSKAINKEVESLIKLETWTVTENKEGVKAIDTRWIFTIKDNGIKKARLVGKGFQIPNKYCQTNYAPVARMSTVRAFLAHSVEEKIPVYQLDIPTAFLNGILESEVYIKIPQGIDINGNKILKLNRSLYGLKQSPKCWNIQFNNTMLKEGLRRSSHDFCLYFKENVQLLVYVDDILLMGEEEEVERVKKLLHKEFNSKDLGEIHKFLGLEINKTKNGLKINQSKQIENILEKFKMTECREANTPMEAGFNAEQKEDIINVPFRELIGSLLFVSSNSRPDITFAVSYLSRFLDKPTESVWRAGKRILRYLKGTKEKGLIYRRQGSKELRTFSDADWASDKSDRKSTSGCAVFYSGKLISWYSKKQSSVALSTAEAEYLAGAQAVCELVNLKGVLSDLNSDNICCKLLIDNQSTLRLIESYENSKRSKHIDIKAHYIKDVIAKKLTSFEYVESNKNVSDIFTKALSTNQHSYLTFKMNIM